MKKLCFLLLLFLDLAAFAQNREVSFQDLSWKQALTNAAQQRKLIFLDAYTSWCAPCKWMVANVFNKDSVADVLNHQFVNVKIDMEKGEGPSLKNKYAIQAFPTYLFINPDGQVVHRVVGSMSKEQFLSEIFKATSPSSSVNMAKRFADGERSRAFVLAYFASLESAYEMDSLASVAETYFGSLPKQELVADSNWVLVKKFLSTPASSAFQWLLNNRGPLDDRYGKESVDSYFSKVFLRRCYTLRARLSKSDIHEIESECNAIVGLLSDKGDWTYAKSTLFQLDFLMLLSKKDWLGYADKLQAAITNARSNAFVPYIVNAMDDMVRYAPPSWYDKMLQWEDQLAANDLSTFSSIQVIELKARILRKLGRKADAQRNEDLGMRLRKEASQKGQITPPIIKN